MGALYIVYRNAEKDPMQFHSTACGPTTDCYPARLQSCNTVVGPSKIHTDKMKGQVFISLHDSRTHRMPPQKSFDTFHCCRDPTRHLLWGPNGNTQTLQIHPYSPRDPSMMITGGGVNSFPANFSCVLGRVDVPNAWRVETESAPHLG